MSTTTDTKARVDGRTKAMEARLAEREQELAAAEEAARRARLREAAEAQVAAEQAEADRTARVDRIVAELPGHLAAIDVEKAHERMEAAIAGYVAVSRQYDDAMAEAYDGLGRSEPLPAGVTISPGSGDITIAGDRYGRVRVQRAIAGAAKAALRAHYPRTQIRLDG